jgi:hypothetical protein
VKAKLFRKVDGAVDVDAIEKELALTRKLSGLQRPGRSA